MPAVSLGWEHVHQDFTNAHDIFGIYVDTPIKYRISSSTTTTNVSLTIRMWAGIMEYLPTEQKRAEDGYLLNGLKYSTTKYDDVLPQKWTKKSTHPSIAAQNGIEWDSSAAGFCSAIRFESSSPKRRHHSHLDGLLTYRADF